MTRFLKASIIYLTYFERFRENAKDRILLNTPKNKYGEKGGGMRKMSNARNTISAKSPFGFRGAESDRNSNCESCIMVMFARFYESARKLIRTFADGSISKLDENREGTRVCLLFLICKLAFSRVQNGRRRERVVN